MEAKASDLNIDIDEAHGVLLWGKVDALYRDATITPDGRGAP